MSPEPNANATTADPLLEMGATGLVESGGVVREEWLPQLAPGKASKVYREMRDNDATIGALLYAIESTARQVEWTTEAADVTPDAKADADFVDECIDDMSHTWSDLMSEALSKIVFGWSYHEIVYKVRGGHQPDDPTHDSRFDDGRIGWRKMPIRAQETLERWEFDDHGGIRGMWQMLPNGERVFVPIEKALLFRTSQHKGNPEGRSMLRNAYRSWWFAKRIQDIEAIGVERDLAGLPIIGVPPAMFAEDASDEVKAALEMWKAIGRNIRMDDQTCIVYPLAYDEHGHEAVKIGLLSTNGSRLFDTSQIIDRYTRSMLMSVLADVILMGHEKVGTQALANEKTTYFLRGLQTLIDAIAQVFNTHAIPRLFALNGWERDAYPRIVPGSLERVDATLLVSMLPELAKAGMPMFPDPATEQFVRAAIGLPETAAWQDGVLPTPTGGTSAEDATIETGATGPSGP